jgi:hypothetical protein
MRAMGDHGQDAGLKQRRCVCLVLRHHRLTLFRPAILHQFTNLIYKLGENLLNLRQVRGNDLGNQTIDMQFL